ncbi:MAG: thioredoxin fold domain-containing protein [Prevotellaceae bacterium]|jgi:thioredoxin-related protein|nr:thioredoxin fold domain-containing protein [Prevotellaceae bacterium]
MMRSLLVAAWLFVVSAPLAAQEVAGDTTLPASGVHWLSLEEAETLHRDTPKNFLFMVYSEDCQWCQKMAQETFADTSIAEKINTRFYAVRFTMAKAGEFFISSLLLNVFNKHNFPAIFFFNENFQPITNLSGYQTLEQFKPYLTYAGETKYYQNMDFDDFKKTWDNIQSIKSNRKDLTLKVDR